MEENRNDPELNLWKSVEVGFEGKEDVEVDVEIKNNGNAPEL